MIYVFLFLLCIVFIELFIFLNLRDQTMKIMELSQAAKKIIGSAELSDDEKELQIRNKSLEIFKATISLTAKFFFIFFVLYLIYRIVVLGFPALEKELSEYWLSLTAVVTLSIMSLLYLWIRNVIRQRLYFY